MNELNINMSNTDWKALREQKQDLIQTIADTHSKAQADSLTGILHFIDHIQDEAEGELGEDVVFGLPTIQVVADIQSTRFEVPGDFFSWKSHERESYLQKQLNNHKAQLENYEEID